jgi:hypothetical protein
MIDSKSGCGKYHQREEAEILGRFNYHEQVQMASSSEAHPHSPSHNRKVLLP